MASRIMRREDILVEEHFEIPKLPILAIRGLLCFRCLLPHKDLKKCAGCKRATYCGNQCQAIDWKKQHKKDCKKLKMVNEIEGMETTMSKSEKAWKNSLYSKFQFMKQQGATDNAMQIIVRQAFCTSCYRSAFQIAPPTELKACGLCQLVFTCTSCSSTHSHEECVIWQRIGDIDIFRTEFFEATGRVTPQAATETPRKTYKPLSSAANWREFYTQISDKKDMLGPFVEPDLSLNPQVVDGVDTDLRASMKRVSLLFTVATDIGTIPLTILSALENSLKDLTGRKRLTIHIVGATGREANHLVIFEELLHLLPSLEMLKVILIGPNSLFLVGSDPEKEVSLDCCPACTSRGRQRTVLLHQGLYHDFSKLARYQKPDLAVLFHSGRSQEEVESWRPTTRFLLNSEILTLCTTYNHREAREEAAELDHLRARFIRRPEVNKWRSLVPMPECLADELEDAMYCMNNISYIFKGKV